MSNMNTEIKYPNIIVDLSRVDGNAFSIMGVVTRAMKTNGVPTKEIEAYRTEAMSGSYDNLLATTMRWVSVEFSDENEDDSYEDYDDDDAY